MADYTAFRPARTQGEWRGPLADSISAVTSGGR